MSTDWARIRLRCFAAVTITSAAVISFSSLQHLAALAGFGALSWLFPLTLDAVAAFGMEIWIRNGPAWRSGATLALVAIIGSLAANVVDHWLISHTVLAALLGATPPGMLAALMFVMHRHIAGQKTRSGKSWGISPAPAPMKSTTASTTPEPAHSNGHGNGHKAGDNLTLTKQDAALTRPAAAPKPDTKPDKPVAGTGFSGAKPAESMPPPPKTPSAAMRAEKAPPRPSASKPETNSVEELTAKVSKRLAAGEHVTKRQIQADYTVGSNKAGEVLKAARASEEVPV